MNSLRFSVDPLELSGIAGTGEREVEEWHINDELAISSHDGKFVMTERSGRLSQPMPPFVPSSFLLHTRRVTKDIEIGGKKCRLDEYTQPWRCCFLRPVSGDGVNHMLAVPDDLRFFRNRRIGLFGAACSGKSVAARTISNYLNVNMHIPADTPYEAATEWIQLHGVPDFKAQVSIFHRQKQLEESILRTGKVAVVDSPFPLTFIYARFYTGADNRRHPLYFKMLEEAARGMDDYADQIYLPPREWVNDGVRYRKGENDDERQALDDMLTSWMREHGTNVLWHQGEMKPPAISRRFLRVVSLGEIFGD